MRQFKKSAIALGVAQIVWMSSQTAMAQTAPATTNDNSAAVVIVTGQRAALSSAQGIKKDSDEIVDSIVADDIGKLPDRSVTEVLQRIVGVTIDHIMSSSDPEHYSVEGSGVNIRGLTYVRSELNGRDEFSANGGRSLNFEDVPPELMAGVDVYKNPSAEQIEGAIGGLVNLRTAMPFDYKGMKGSISVQDTYSTLAGGSPSPSLSGMFSNRWDTELGQFGFLIDLAHSGSKTRTDGIQVEPYWPRTDVVAGSTVWVPNGAEYRTLDFDRKRDGAYLALEWKKGDFHSSLTYFQSHYKMTWNENALFSANNGFNTQVTNGTYSANGNLLTGTLTDTKDGGINFNNDTRTANQVSDTKDVAWNLIWRPTNALTLTSDLQFIRSTNHTFDSTVTTGLYIPDETINLTGSRPSLSFSAADYAAMANPNNYYWGNTMEDLTRAVATEEAWKGDVKYDFDSSVLRDIRFGVRLTNRNSQTESSNGGNYNWSVVTAPWQMGWDIKSLAYLGSNPTNASIHNFTNFFGGSVSVPSLYFPNSSLTSQSGYPANYATVHAYINAVCQPWASSYCGLPYTPAAFGSNNQAGVNDLKEQTEAAYSQLRFGFDELKYPIDGNVGIRYVFSQQQASGYGTFNPSLPTIPAGANVTGSMYPNIPAYAKAIGEDKSYIDALPSLNLRMKASDKLQFRFAYSNAMTRPDPSQLQAQTALSESVNSTTTTVGGVSNVNINNYTLSGTSAGNPDLKPITSNQFDLSAEWYFSKVGSLTMAVFDKNLKNIILNQTYNYAIPDANGNLQNFAVTGPVNGASGSAQGLEVAYQQYFDKLPGWLSGFGLQANFTVVRSHEDPYNAVYQPYCTGGTTQQNYLVENTNGCDLNGKTFGSLPLQGMSRHTANISLLYDQGPISARLAYNWRSQYLQGVNVNGTNANGSGIDMNPASPNYNQEWKVNWALPTWGGAYGQLDASVFYNITSDITIGLEAQNIANSTYHTLMQQGNGMEGRSWFTSGPRYTAQLRYNF